MKDLILLHGALGTSSMFDELAERLKNDFRIHRLNFSGHGTDTGSLKELSMDLFAGDLLSYMDSHHLGSADVFGYSMGGYVAMYLACKHPERFRKLMTLATVFDWSAERAAKEAAMLDPEKVEAKVPAFAGNLSAMHGTTHWKVLMKMTAGMMIQLGNDHLTEKDFASLQFPVRICVGDRDKMVSVESSLVVSRQLSRGSLVVLPETPHPFEQVNHDRLTYEVRDFFVEENS